MKNVESIRTTERQLSSLVDWLSLWSGARVNDTPNAGVALHCQTVSRPVWPSIVWVHLPIFRRSWNIIAENATIDRALQAREWEPNMKMSKVGGLVWRWGCGEWEKMLIFLYWEPPSWLLSSLYCFCSDIVFSIWCFSKSVCLHFLFYFFSWYNSFSFSQLFFLSFSSLFFIDINFCRSSFLDYSLFFLSTLIITVNIALFL